MDTTMKLALEARAQSKHSADWYSAALERRSNEGQRSTMRSTASVDEAKIGQKIADIQALCEAHKVHCQQKKVAETHWLSAEEEARQVLKAHGADSWQHHLVRFIHSHRVQIVIIILLAGIP